MEIRPRASPAPRMVVGGGPFPAIPPVGIGALWRWSVREESSMARAFIFALGLASCTTDRPGSAAGEIPAPHPLPPAVEGGEAIALHEGAPFASLRLPPDSRGGRPLADGVVLRGLTLHGGDDKVGYTFRTTNPIKPRAMFFARPAPGLTLTRADGANVPYRHRPRRSRVLNWSMDRDYVYVRGPDPEPPEGLLLRYPPAVERERRMHLQPALEAGLVRDEADFVRATVQIGWSSREGLLLPAPAEAVFEVAVPPAAVLTFAPGLARPELADQGGSDGCDLTITVDGETVWSDALELERFPIQRLDLSRFEGRTVRLGFRTDPRGHATDDFCFVGEPILSSVKARPRRVLLVFLDTVRPDHLTVYGYERATTPRLATWAEGATVFEQARSIAPWTLPSARAVVTGRHPELYASAAKLPEIVGERGFATAMIAGNTYLTANFDAHLGWDYHTVELFQPADAVTDAALRWMGEHRGQDQLLLVHYMNAHLPYKEPAPYRSLWAGEAPSMLPDNFLLRQVRTAERQGLDASGKQYIRDRYDQTLRWIDDELARLLSALHPDDVVVIFSDHGEEFWDHGGYEHGHTLYDELLRVPLLVRAPAMPSGRIDTPVSLLDLAPTVLELLGLPHDRMDGTSLVPLAKGDPSLRAMLEERPQTFGRPLYGHDRWGVLHRSMKYITHDGRESVFDIQKDPGETNDLAADAALVERLRSAMGRGLGTDGVIAWRLLPSANATKFRDVTLELHVKGGVRAAFPGGDPHRRTPVTIERPSPEQVRITWHHGIPGGGAREVYVVPKAPIEEATPALSGQVLAGERYPWTMPADAPHHPSESRRRLVQLSIPEGAITMYWGMVPLPPEGGALIDATDAETTEALEQLGYADPDRGAPR